MAEYFVHPYLTRDAAEGIVERGVKMLGVDTLSPDGREVNGRETLECTKRRLIVANVDALSLLDEGKDVSEDWVISFVPLYLGGVEDGSRVCVEGSASVPFTTSYKLLNLDAPCHTFLAPISGFCSKAFRRCGTNQS
ncbi:hypothetical protein F5887DRAFT_986387 [Amanita rubescens]|nr:hypothetical protein F5887DRAFT_986387 [Amanita rubescens]